MMVVTLFFDLVNLVLREILAPITVVLILRSSVGAVSALVACGLLLCSLMVCSASVVLDVLIIFVMYLFSSQCIFVFVLTFG